ncbi:MAG: hypothetical protein ACE5GA_11745 [Candidatus Zixiibacteriota bacterium]
MYKRPTSQSEIEIKRRRINRRINWASLAIVLVAGVGGVLLLGERIGIEVRALTLAAVVAWVVFRLWRMRQSAEQSTEHDE